MDWKTKAKVHSFFDHLPLGHHFYYFLQKNITKSLPRKPNEKYFQYLDWHLENIARNNDDLSKMTLFEFGAGWDLFYNIAFYCYGIERQILVDLNRHAKVELINHEIKFFNRLNKEGLVRKPPGPVSSLDDLARLGIDYQAPGDARKTTLADSSIDAIVSTNTMEHIPFDGLTDILKECFRILRPGGILSARVDYADHYSYADKSIGAFNYMKYSDQEWKAYNPDGHFQNRGRHSQYVALFEQSGLECISSKPLFEYPQETLPNKNHLAPEFQALSIEDLTATGGLFCLQKNADRA